MTEVEAQGKNEQLRRQPKCYRQERKMLSTMFNPATIKGIQLKNRFVRSATAEGMSTVAGYPTQELKELYCQLAEGEVGLIITSGTFIEAWKNYPATLGLVSPLAIYDDRYVEPWQKIVSAVHKNGAKIAMQIGHLGRQDIPLLRGSPPIAPSATPTNTNNTELQEMSESDIYDIVEKFAKACQRVKAAGFDAVQFHGAHGNLINNFMSPLCNVRTDRYGGAVENRARFMVEIIHGSRELVGADFPLMIKMNFNDFVPGGLEEEDAVEIAVILEQAGIDCIEVSGGILSESKDQIAVKGIATEERESYFRAYAKKLKERVSIPVILVGGHRSLNSMTQIIERGEADFLSMSRPLIREPGLIRRWKNNDQTKAKCVSCNQCFENWVFRPLRCYVDNPLNEE